MYAVPCSFDIAPAGETGTVLQIRHALGANGAGANPADSSDAWLAVLLLDSGHKQVRFALFVARSRRRLQHFIYSVRVLVIYK